MSLAPDHHELMRELESIQDEGQASHILRKLRHQVHAAAALQRSLSALSVEVTPEQAYRGQVTEGAWREIEREFGLLTSAEVAQRVGSTAKAGSSYASDARRDGRLLGVKRMNRVLYPGFQIGSSGPLPVIRDVHQAAQDLQISEEAVILWLTAPTTWWSKTSRPVDHLHEPQQVLAAFEAHYSTEW